MNYSNPLDAVPDVSLETRLIITENQCAHQTQTFEKNILHLEMLPGTAPVLVT